MMKNFEIATFGAGCFWCVEAVFQQLIGVETVVSGYTGGQVLNPSYKQVCEGNTGHAEVVQITFDSFLISFTELLEVFFTVHDPTTLNRQGGDVGTQYRSSIFYHNDDQKQVSSDVIAQLDKEGAFLSKIVTSLEKYDIFYTGEDYHQNYFNLNGEQPYCSMVVRPKVQKFEKVFKAKLKKN